MRMQINRVAAFSQVVFIMFIHSSGSEQAGVNNEHLQNEINTLKMQVDGQKNKIESLEQHLFSETTADGECHTAGDLMRLEVEMSGLKEVVNKIDADLKDVKTDMLRLVNDSEHSLARMANTNVTVEKLVDLFSALNDSFTSFSKDVSSSAYSQWFPWTECSNGSQVRYRTCSFGNEDNPLCRGPIYDNRLCCPFGYYDLQEFGFLSCIRYYHLSKTHASAKVICENEIAHLIEITSKEKKAVVKDYIFKQKNLNKHQYFHIDGELVNGTWVNRDGVPLGYLPWGAKPYLKPGWIYLGLHPEDFLIYDIQIDYVRQFVCEVDV